MCTPLWIAPSDSQVALLWNCGIVLCYGKLSLRALLIMWFLQLGIFVVHFLDYTIGCSWWLMVLYLLEILAVFVVRGRPYSGETVVTTMFSRSAGCLQAWAAPLLIFTWNVILPVALVVRWCTNTHLTKITLLTLSENITCRVDRWLASRCSRTASSEICTTGIASLTTTGLCGHVRWDACYNFCPSYLFRLSASCRLSDTCPSGLLISWM